MKRIKISLLIAAVAVMLTALTPAASAAETDAMTQKINAGWGCAADVGLPDGHCVNPAVAKRFLAGDIPQTFQLLVFDEGGNFLTAEVATSKDADARACPNDPESPDGTYWLFGGILWVCHHQAG